VTAMGGQRESHGKMCAEGQRPGHDLWTWQGRGSLFEVEEVLYHDLTFLVTRISGSLLPSARTRAQDRQSVSVLRAYASSSASPWCSRGPSED
jgi:hypothetical protein